MATLESTLVLADPYLDPRNRPNPEQLEQPDDQGSSQQLTQPQVVTPRSVEQTTVRIPATAADAELKPFGYDLFAGVPSTFAPATDIPVPSEYVIGPGDNVHLQLFGGENASYRLVVSRDGRINLPKIGPIEVAGLTFEQLKELIEERVSTQLVGVETSITLGELKSIQVFVLGDAYRPGSYTVSSLSTITNALFVSGGVSAVGSLRKIQLKRAGKIVQKLDLYDLLLRGDSSKDSRLQPGDVIFIPPVGPRVSVGGEVKRPAIYELSGERTVREVVQLAGGLPATTDVNTAQLERINEESRRVLVKLNLANAADLQRDIRDGDSLRVWRVADRLVNSVRIIGYVERPGHYQWSEGMRLNELLHFAQGILTGTEKEPYLLMGILERTNLGTGIREMQVLNLQHVLSNPAESMILEKDDEIIILSRVDIAYLGSEDVLNVLNAQAPIRGKKARQGVSIVVAPNPATGTGAGTQAGVSQAPTTSLPAVPQPSRNGASPQEAFIGGACEGLRELAEIVNTQRSLRFALAVSETGTRADVTVRNIQKCPSIFQQAPRALPFLLEHAVALHGEVREPGVYPIAPDTSVGLLVQTAGGLTSEADPSNVEYVSYKESSVPGKSPYEILNLSHHAVLSKNVSPGDLITFRPIYTSQEPGTVQLVGEFRFPGVYNISRSERLSGLFERAGGLTENAYPYGTVFTRESAKEAEAAAFKRSAKELQEALITAITSGAIPKESVGATEVLGNLIKRLETEEPVGRIVVETDPAVLQNKPESDITLERGDAIYVPKRSSTVTVIGQVLNPGTVAFKSSARAKDYISLAGGFSEAADEKRVFVVLPNGAARSVRVSVWNHASADIPPGSTVVVPRDPTPINALVLADKVTRILSQLAISAAAIVAIDNRR